MALRAEAWPERSIGIMCALPTSQPNTGIRSSSRFSTKQASGKNTKGPMKSNIDWCLAATRAGPGGRRSSPRTSTLMPQITQRAHMCSRPQNLMARISTRRGMASSSR